MMIRIRKLKRSIRALPQHCRKNLEMGSARLQRITGKGETDLARQRPPSQGVGVARDQPW